MKESISLPHPVLGIDDDIKDSSFQIGFITQIINDESFKITINSIDIKNDYFNKLLNDGLIEFNIWLLCSSTYYHTNFRFTAKETELEVSLENLANHLELEIFIIAKEGFEYYDTSFNEDYLLGQNKGVFTIKRGDIVGWGGKMRISLGESFINSAQRMFQFKPNSNPYVEIDLTDQNCIIVNYPKKLNEDDVDMMNYLTKSNPFVSLQIFIIPALIEAISEIRKQGENKDDFINDYSWAMILDETIDGITDESVSPSLLAQEYVTKLLRKNRPLSHLLLTELKGN